MANYQIMAASVSDAGVVKTVNEDNCIYRISDAFESTAAIFAVADGVGGLAKGDVASSIATVTINNWWNETVGKNDDIDSIVKTLIAAFSKANSEIIGSTQKSATTLSALLIYNGKFYVVHVGDSRIYKYNGKLQMLTKDQTCLIEKVVDGSTVKKNVLTDCIGGKERFDYFCNSGEIKKNEIFLLCSDGVFKSCVPKTRLLF